MTTYTYTTQDTGTDTVSASDDERLPPGGFSLSHGFPQWYRRQPTSDNEEFLQPLPVIVEVLFYLRNAFTSNTLLDSIPLEAAANPGAWHAWQSYMVKEGRAPIQSVAQDSNQSPGARQQPGGARKPGEWNWDGVWEDRVRKGIRASVSEHSIYRIVGPSEDLVGPSPCAWS